MQHQEQEDEGNGRRNCDVQPLVRRFELLVLP